MLAAAGLRQLRAYLLDINAAKSILWALSEKGPLVRHRFLKWSKLLTPWTVHLFFFLAAIVTWPILAEFEVFERFYEFSRDHEDLDIDEMILLVVNLTIALLISTLIQSHRLRRAVKARENDRQRAEKSAQRDPLTGLMNRRAFSIILDQTAQSLSTSQSRIVAMVDLDRFKLVNDLQGHGAGDATLRAVSKRIKNALDGSGTLARLGGDEFSIVFAPEIRPGDAERLAKKIIDDVSAPYKLDEVTVHIGCSIGLYDWQSGVTTTRALALADRALYAAKNSGRGKFHWYDASLDLVSSQNALIETELRTAIINNEIEPWFQPIIDLKTGAIAGFEVLARWRHPTMGRVSPGIFIQIAEESGQIGALGQSLLSRACEIAAHWPPNLELSVNLSPIQFHDSGLVASFKSTLAETGLDPNRLIVEVIESTVIDDFPTAAERLLTLKSLGIRVSLDDFGTGFSSLASLRHLPIDRIKIDRGFVTAINSQPDNQKIVSAIIALSQEFDLHVTAEGIETANDLAFIKALGCQAGQGFYFAQAVSSDQVLKLIANQPLQSKVG